MTDDRVQIEAILRNVLSALVQGRFTDLERECGGVRVTAQEMKLAVEDYGDQLVMPPEQAYADEIDAVRVATKQRPEWSVRFPLWGFSEGRTDLSLEMTVYRDGPRWRYEIDGIHVL